MFLHLASSLKQKEDRNQNWLCDLKQANDGERAAKKAKINRMRQKPTHEKSS
jgi:hypothetical protein